MVPVRGNPLRWFLGVTVLLMSGCASSTSTAPVDEKPSVLIAVQVAGGAPPTPAQSATVFQAVSAELVRVGYRIAKRADSADFEVDAVIVPDVIDSKQGAIKVSDVRPIRRPSDYNSRLIRAQLRAAQDQQNALDNWGRSREAPTYSVP